MYYIFYHHRRSYRHGKESSSSKLGSIGATMIDVAVAVGALSVLYKVDQTFDPSAMLAPQDCAVLAVATCGLGFAFRGIIGLFLSFILSLCGFGR
jgi:hypothetical protein